jgi:hypothetical protein
MFSCWGAFAKAADARQRGTGKSPDDAHAAMAMMDPKKSNPNNEHMATVLSCRRRL